MHGNIETFLKSLMRAPSDRVWFGVLRTIQILGSVVLLFLNAESERSMRIVQVFGFSATISLIAAACNFWSGRITGHKYPMGYVRKMNVQHVGRVAIRKPRHFDVNPISLLCVMSHFLPERIAHEEFGDYLESANEMIRKGEPRRKLYAHILTVAFWVSINSLEYLAKTYVRGKSSV